MPTSVTAAVPICRVLEWSRPRCAVFLACLGAAACASTGPNEGRSSNQADGVPTVVVVPHVDSIGIGQSVQFADTVLTSNGQVVTGATIVWGGTNPNVASVSINGRAVGIAKGKDTIEALVGSGVGTAVLTVGGGSLTKITLSPATPTVRNGSSMTLNAVFLDATGDTLTGYVPVWTSTATNIATVSSQGMVTGIAPGTDTVKATAAGVTGVSVVSVVAAPIGAIVVVPARDTLQVGATVQLNDTVKDVNGNVLKGQPVVWSSSATSVATVSGSGRVTGVGAGTAQISASSGAISGAATVIVPLNNTPTTETFVFDRDTLVPFGVPYDISQHVRWVLKNSLGDSVGAVGLASVSAVTYYPVLGNGAPGPCTVLAGTFVAYCPDGGGPTGSGTFQYNGYWSVTVRAKEVKGVPDQHNTIWWFVNSGVAGSQPLTYAVSRTPGVSVLGGDTLNLAGLDTIHVTTPSGLVVSSLPVVGWVSAMIQTGAGVSPGPAPCNPGLAPTLIVCFPTSSTTFQAIGYTALVSLKPAIFNGIVNPAFTGGIDVQVNVPPPPTVSIFPTADTVIVGDTIVFVARATDPGVPGTPVVSWACCAKGILDALSSTTDTMVTDAVAPGTDTVTAYAETPGSSDINEIGSAAASILVESPPPGTERARRARLHFVTMRLRPRATAGRR